MSRARDLADSADLSFDGSTLSIDTTNNRVGIGTTSPGAKLGVGGGAGNAKIKLSNTASGSGNGDGFDLDFTGTDIYITNRESGFMAFENAGAERMRLDSSGDLLIGKTANSSNTVGIELFSTGQLVSTAVGDEVIIANRKSSNGKVIAIRKDNTEVGFLGSESGGNYLTIGNADTGLMFHSGDNNIYPYNPTSLSYNDNFSDLGWSGARFDDIFATNGTIQTSDRNEKQDIEELSAAEQRVAVAAKSLMRKFRWKDAVAEKGDDARIHFGIIAQDLQAAFEAEGLDAGRYAMFCSGTWWETQTDVPAVEEELDEEGNVVVEAKEAYTRTDTYHTAEEAPEGAVERTRLGVRYPELLAFIIAAL